MRLKISQLPSFQIHKHFYIHQLFLVPKLSVNKKIYLKERTTHHTVFIVQFRVTYEIM